MHVKQFSAHESNPAPKVALGVSESYFQWIVRVGMGAIVVLAMAYLMMLNALATLGFDLENLKGENLALKKQVEAWDIEIAIPSSLYALESLEEVQAMSRVQQKTYLTIERDRVAMEKVVNESL